MCPADLQPHRPLPLKDSSKIEVLTLDLLIVVNLGRFLDVIG